MRTSVKSNESGMAIITALLVLMLASGLMAGMFAALITDQRSHATDRDQSMAYAAAHAGLEKLTSTLGTLFDTDFSPSAAQIDAIDNFPPAIPNFEYTSPGQGAGSGYTISFTPDPGPGPNTGNPLAQVATITTGNWEGLRGLITPYVITVTAKSTTGHSEVRLRRELQTVAVPVFQFGIFGQNDLGFHAGPDFDFGGRVHTNASLYLAQGTGNDLWFRDKITAFTQVKRNTLMNGAAITTTNHTGIVHVPTDLGSAWRDLLDTESSGTTASPWSGWQNLSVNTYKTNIRTETTGAKLLTLPLAMQGAQPIDLIRRPATNSNEHNANRVVYDQRLFGQAALRILLSDRAADITSLPTVSAQPPVDLSNLAAAGVILNVVGRPMQGATEGEIGENGLFGHPVTFARVSAIVGGAGGATLTIQTSPNVAFAAPVANVPSWLRWKDPVGAQFGLRKQLGNIVLNCTGLTSNQLNGCTGTVANPLPAFLDNDIIEIHRADNGPAIARANGAHAIRTTGTNNIINIKNFTTAQNFVASRVFFVGEDAVTCTGFTATTLTNCTWNAAGTLAVNDPVYMGSTMQDHQPFLHGFIKIERRNQQYEWIDVTTELLNLGFSGRNQDGDICADPTPNAVIRLQRLRDNGLTAGGCAVAANNYSASLTDHDHWPNVLFDAREGNTRLQPTNAGMNVGGIFSYVAFDVNNYRRWLSGEFGGSGLASAANPLNANGFIVYFSDRRGNHDTLAPGEPETGEYGFEDSLNPTAQVWNRDTVLNGGEDVNGNGTLQRYGERPWDGDAAAPNYIGAGAVAPFRSNVAAPEDSSPWVQMPVNQSGRGRLARVVLFRRALKIINGGMPTPLGVPNGAANSLPTGGFTMASENPVYIQGNFNATSTDVAAEPNVAAAVMADSITLLSNAFVDGSTFRDPNNMTNRNATQTSYRFAMITGKAVPFQHPGWGVAEWGSDGGVHNFMRMLEDWGGGVSLDYRGSMVSLFFSRQAVAPYRADANVYSPPDRGYNFDTDFLTPALLPPGTPAFRDINTLKFRQILRPNQ